MGMSKDGRIQIYNCNIFDISSDIIGEVDAIWDRGGITAIEPLDMGRYLDVITSNMNAYTRYCLVVVDYDPSVKSGARLSIEKIGETSALREILVKKGHKYFNDVLFLLTLKP
uniref:Thiopurine S-methyltransferase-like n=1 Tax=Saccoglossus kowalevskii TaxID=10224 RepID=A0ABM0MFC7_SACKO|nr:PREDICTED: thiopurine S-methyltransferase-like [Saccoglossus kowalevskii]